MSRKTRKLIWSVPLVATLAIVGALALFLTLTPSQTEAQAEEIPGMPINLTATGLTPTSIELAWDPPTDGGTPDGYRIDRSENGLVWYALESSYGSTVYTDDDGLKAKQMRYYRVFAFNSSGHGSVFGPVSAETKQSTVPKAVDDLSAGEDEASIPEEQITLTWTAPDHPEGAPVVSYRIQSSKNGTSFSNLKTDTASKFCPDGEACTYTQKDLLESTKLWYRVYATNSVGESKASNTDSDTTNGGMLPEVPQGLRAGLNPAGQMWLYWDEPVEVAGATPLVPDDPAGAPILGYYVQGGPVTRDVPATAFIRPAGVVGTNDDNDDPRRDVLFFVEASTDIALTPSVLNKLDNFRGKPVVGRAFVAGDTSASPPVLEVTEIPQTQWGFRVMAVNQVVDQRAKDGVIAQVTGNIEASDGKWSNIIRVNHWAEDLRFDPNQTEDDILANGRTPKIDDDLLSRPTLTAGRDTNVEGGRTNIILKWEVDDSVVATRYRLEYSEDRTDWQEVMLPAITDGSGKQEFPHGVREAGTTYYYRVFATHVNPLVGEGTPPTDIFTEASLTASETTAQPDKPNAPTLTGVEAISETEIEISWDRTGMNGSTEVGYGKLVGFRVDESDDGENWTIWMANTGLKDVCGPLGKALECSVTRKDLLQGQTKYYRVFTLNNASRTSLKISDPSDADSATTLKSLASDDPGGLVVKSTESTAIKLLWNARADDITAAPIIGYKIESSPLNAEGDCAATWTVLIANTMSTTTSYTDTGLMPETGYCYRIFGINVVATSSGFVGFGDDYVTTYDNDAIAITAAGSVVTVLTAPTNVMAIADDADPGDIDVVVTWTPGENAVEGHVVLLFTSDFTAVPHTDVPTLDGMHTFMSVSPGSYVAVVVAIESRSNYLYDYDRVTVGQ